MADRKDIPSPCIGVCAVDGRTGLCEGCGRTLKEIGSWSGYGPIEQAEILRALPARLDRLGDQARGGKRALEKIEEALARLGSG